jgi:hypothetical protein
MNESKAKSNPGDNGHNYHINPMGRSIPYFDMLTNFLKQLTVHKDISLSVVRHADKSLWI